jgi:ABC-type nitrate/sulfonate/bicarbonate transport system permease component
MTLLLPLVLAAAILGVWQYLVRSRDVASIVLPAPTDIWSALVDGRQLLWSEAIVTLRHTLVGVVLATVIGVGLALALSTSWIVRTSVRPLIVALQAIPIVAIAPAFVLWFGIESTSKYVTVAFVCVFPVFFQAASTLATLPSREVDVLVVLRASRWEILRHVAAPQLLHRLLPSMQLLAGLGVVGAVVAEWSGSLNGLGALLQSSRRVSDSAQVWAVVTVLALIVMCLTGIVAFVGRFIARHYRADLSA